MSDMYKTIENLCQKRGITITALCRETGVARSCLSELKRGATKKLTFDNAAAIAKYFNVSVEALNGEAEIKNDDELNNYLEQLRNRPEMRMLFSVADGATKEEIEQAVKIIEALRK